MSGVHRLVNAEFYKKKIVKGRGLAKQIEQEFSQPKIAQTKPENFPKKKASK
jgi:hypothetical protein